MPSKGLSRAGLALALLVAARTGIAQLPEGTAHWKSTVDIEGAPQQGVGPVESEIWVRKGDMRSKMVVMGMTRNVVKSGDTMYQWAEGEKTGMKFNTAVAQRQAGAGEYASRIDEYRSKGKKIGSEKIDGHPCDIYELDTPGGEDRDGREGRDRKETVWLASDLHNFPVKVVVESGDMKVTSRNRDVEFPATLPPSMMSPPSEIQFRDMSDMLRNSRPTAQ